MYQRILVPIDGSPTSARSLLEAIAVGQLTGGRLRLLHVVDETSFALGAQSMGGLSGDLITLLREAGQQLLDAAKAQVEAAGLGVDAVLRDSLAGAVCTLVVEEAKAWPADLIVLGTHGRRGTARLFLGSDAEQIARIAPVPLLLVRSAGQAVAA